jgi:hypothetical protein
MEGNASIRWGWLKAMYIYTFFGAGGFGLGMLFFPGTIQSVLRFPPQDPVVLGLYGSFLLASGLLAIPALRFPLKFTPLLLIQLVYKPIWLVAVALPLFLKGQFPFYVVFISVIFLTFIIGDLIAIPFSYLFSKK